MPNDDYSSLPLVSLFKKASDTVTKYLGDPSASDDKKWMTLPGDPRLERANESFRKQAALDKVQQTQKQLQLQRQQQGRTTVGQSGVGATNLQAPKKVIRKSAPLKISGQKQ